MRRARRKAEEDLLPEALQDMRMALKIRPGDPVIILEMADTLSVMGRYDQSNELLLPHLSDPNLKCPQAYTIAGKNFLELREESHARDCLELALSMDPDEDLAYYIMSLMDAADEDEEEDSLPQLHIVGRDEDSYGRAMDLLKNRKHDKALKVLDEHLRDHPSDIRALCAKAAALNESDRKKEADEILDSLCSKQFEEPEDVAVLAQTLGWVGRHGDVLKVLGDTPEEYPEMPVLSHMKAASLYNLGQFARAREIWRRLLLIDPEDTVFSWFEKQARLASEGKQECRRVPYMQTVPAAEVMRRIRQLSVFSARNDLTLEEIQKDPDLAETIRWMLEEESDTDRTGLLQALFLLRGREAESDFRKLLVRRSISADEKKDILGFLRHMDAKEPYIVLMDDGLVEAKVRIMESETLAMDKVESILIEKCTIIAASPEDPEKIVSFWHRCCAEADYSFDVHNPEAWAAAVLYVYLQIYGEGEKITQKEAAERFGVSVSTVSRIVRVLNGLNIHRQGE